MKKNEQEVEALSKKYDVDYLNYSALVLPDSLFYNWDHLNVKGAAVITKKINDHLISITN